MLLVSQSVSLASYTTLRVGGSAELVTVSDEAELQAAFLLAKNFSAPPLFLGGGSNLLVSDTGYEGLVIKAGFTSITYTIIDAKTVQVTAGAGVLLDELVADTVQKGYWGLENLSGIPGTVGATPIQNVGAYGVEVSDLITSVRVCDLQQGVCYERPASECDFAYRDSWFKSPAGQAVFVTAVTFLLSQTPTPKLSYQDIARQFSDSATAPAQSAIRTAVLAIRSAKFPDWHTIGTAGSFFKNPIVTQEQFLLLQKQWPELPAHIDASRKVKISLGYVLDKICPLRGYRLGAVGLSPHQALVLINYGGATAREIDDFANWVTVCVEKKTNIKIEREVRRV